MSIWSADSERKERRERQEMLKLDPQRTTTRSHEEEAKRETGG